MKAPTRKVIYTVLLAFCLSLIASPAAAQQQESTSSIRNLVREKVKEKLATLAKKPSALTGTLEQITDSTLEVKTRDGKVQLASTTDQTLYLRIGGSKRNQIKFADLVLGEFVVVMGYRNDNGVLEAKRVVAYDKKPTNSRQAVYGVVTKTEKTALSIQHPKTSPSPWTVKISSKTKITAKVDTRIEEVGLDQVKVGDRIAAAGTADPKTPNTLQAKRVHVIPGAARGLLQRPKPTTTPSIKPTPTTLP